MAVRIIKGKHMWDGSVWTTEVAFGVLERWKSGEVGGGSEEHSTRIITKEPLAEEQILALESVFGIQSGTPFDSKRVPPKVTKERQISLVNEAVVDQWSTVWTYWPSTN
jgi:hypothetical protein